MKKIIQTIAMCVLVSCFCSCKNKPQEVIEPIPTPPAKQEVYQPKHQSSVIDLKSAKKYEYVNAPYNEPAISVELLYNNKVPYAQPITIRYKYENGDSYTYTIPSELGLRANENGKFRILSDKENTVWIQGQTRKGKFHEFVFYGNPKYNGKKIKPNSYLNPPTGEIKYQQ